MRHLTSVAALLLLAMLAACASTPGSRQIVPETLAVPAAPAPAPGAAALETRIDSVFAHFGPTTPACAVGVFRAGEVVFAKGYGMANLEHGVPITPEMVFEIDSNTKQFTALAIHILARQGRISLDDDVRTVTRVHRTSCPASDLHVAFRGSMRGSFSERFRHAVRSPAGRTRPAARQRPIGRPRAGNHGPMRRFDPKVDGAGGSLTARGRSLGRVRS